MSWLRTWANLGKVPFWDVHRTITAKAAAERFQRRSEAAKAGWRTRRRRRAEAVLTAAREVYINENSSD